MVEIKKATQNKTIVFKNSPCIVSMDFDDTATHDRTSHNILGLRKNEDIVVQNGRIADIGPGLARKYEQSADCEVVDASQCVVMPGMVDAHVHPIFGGSRAHETVLKSQGFSYAEIATRGGGILSSMNSTREASSDELTATFVRNAQLALSRGVVLMESKTGYGLSPAEELRLLECMYSGFRDGGPLLPKIAPTLLGPHAASPEHRGLDSYIQALIEFLPQYAAAAGVAAENGFGLPLAVDVFVERNYFSVEQAELWLAAALQYGLDVHIHADEFSRSGGCELAAALATRREQGNPKLKQKGRVLSVDHCQYATESDLTKLHALNVAAVVLPTTSFFSDIPYVEAPKFRASGIRLAIASDFNPGSAPINNLWFSAFLALSKCKFALSEVYAGVTKNAAHALGASDEFGTIAKGRPAHMVLFRGKTPDDFFASPLGDHVEYVVVGA